MITLSNIEHNKNKYQSILNELYKVHQNQSKEEIRSMYYSELLQNINLFNLYQLYSDIHHINYSDYLSFNGIDSSFISGDSKIVVEAKNRNEEKYGANFNYKETEVLERKKALELYAYHLQGCHTFYITFYNDYTILYDLHSWFNQFKNEEEVYKTCDKTYFRPATSHGFGTTNYVEVPCTFLLTKNALHITLPTVYQLNYKIFKELNKIFS